MFLSADVTIGVKKWHRNRRNKENQTKKRKDFYINMTDKIESAVPRSASPQLQSSERVLQCFAWSVPPPPSA